MKQKIYQQYVYKIHSNRILTAKDKNLIISLSEARLNNEIISLADSNVLRNIDELNGLDRTETTARVQGIRKRISELNHQTTNLAAARNERKRLYAELDTLQFKSDYLMVVMDKASDFDELNKGFRINGIEFKRLVGTANGTKQSTIVYCSADIYNELEKRLNGGRDETKALIPAKFEAYKSLACSASISVSIPKDILVVDDFILNVKASYIQLEDSETYDEPVETYVVDGEVELNASDGFGLMLPTLAERWSDELGLDYVAGGMCIRNLFCKGMVYTFDFKEFAKRYYDSDTIKDVWGTVHNVNDIELILPVSVMKLWDSYNSLEHYLECCEKYYHGFAVTKTCEKELENERTLNYQFIQSYELTDDEIRELVMPTVNDLKETLYGNPDKTVLFLHGACAENYNFDKDDNYHAKAIMINPELARDPCVINRIRYMMDKARKLVKIGKIKVHGNYAVISGDPFAFCQSIFKCDVPDEEKGLLKAGEMYSRYWVDDNGSECKRVVCFRAPMSCHNNIRAMDVIRSDEIDYWYRYMGTINIINVHDMFYPAENGADNDGDAVFTTDNCVLLDKWRDEPAILCVQKKGQKSVITQENLASSNKNGFGNAIGTITNRITAMYDIISTFPPGSEQRKILEYRIRCGQQYQQAEIDKIKGIVSKPMPKEWYDIHSVRVKADDNEFITEMKNKNREIIADKKPYFMRYIYSNIDSEVEKYIKAAQSQSVFVTGLALDELLEKEAESLSEIEKKYLEDYYKYLPVSDTRSTINRLCHLVEKELKKFERLPEDKTTNFASMLKSVSNSSKLPKNKKQLTELYAQYRKEWRLLENADCDSEEKGDLMDILQEDFRRKCTEICPDPKQLCDTLIEICYKGDKSKKFVWDMCGKQIIENLLNRHGSYTFYVIDNNGEVEFRGKKYRKITRSVFDTIDNKEDFK